MVSKKKAARTGAFQKVKLKVGKTLKKTNTTDTTFKSKKVVLLTQLQENDDNSTQVNYRGKSLEELCKQLGHFNKNFRKDALVGTKQLLTAHPEMIQSQLRILIPCIARMISDQGNDVALNGQLKSLLELVCTAPAHVMSVHITLFLAHVLRALTHMHLNVRSLALSVLFMLLRNYGSLCRNNRELFTAFVQFLASSRKPAWNKPRFIECIATFMKVYDVEEACDDDVTIHVSLATKNGVCDKRIDLTPPSTRSPFDFCVVTSAVAVAGSASPFERPEALLQLSEAISPLVATSLAEDQGGQFLADTLALLECVGRVVERQSNAFLVADFSRKLKTAWQPVRKVVEQRKSDRIRQAALFLL